MTKSTGRPVGRPPRPPLPYVGVAEAAKRGRLELYIALRQLAAAQLDQGCAAREWSSLVILLQQLAREIEAMTSPREPWQVPDSPAELADN
jgi:hypothetical protein